MLLIQRGGKKKAAKSAEGRQAGRRAGGRLGVYGVPTHSMWEKIRLLMMPLVP